MVVRRKRPAGMEKVKRMVTGPRLTMAHCRTRSRVRLAYRRGTYKLAQTTPMKKSNG